MKIGQSADLPNSVSQAASANAQKAGQSTASASNTATATAASAGVSVSVSNLARALEKPEATAASDVDVEKVAAVKAAIQDGTYTVNARAIADKLLSNAQEMLQRTVN